MVPSGPDSPNDAIYDALLTAIFRAETRFWVATPYFIPDEPLMRALTVAAHRGIDVRIFVPARSNHLLADLVAGPVAARARGRRGAGATATGRCSTRRRSWSTDSLAVVGSANFDMRSLFLDYEVALFFSGREEVARLARWFDGHARGVGPGAPRGGVDAGPRGVGGPAAGAAAVGAGG